MRPPLEYGDNFPVPSGVWNPAEPWRFPKYEVTAPRQGLLSYVLPWITLGLGVSLGILWMSWRTELVGVQPEPGVLKGPRQEEVFQFPSAPAPKPVKVRLRSQLA